ncbi:putative UDP-rhamnose:rhamnosyltransferase 1 [Oryza brachyantha]|uniref:putative UDP-rhamnose:rhamnosyltransferase 1 n=1 Tax=Oryza brachyantha TaxID=4533 RepID=UPI001AD9C9C7|nr:putative UDP-rhamnose:rhamnosyltransferase 1 [Oryza brachyantha]
MDAGPPSSSPPRLHLVIFPWLAFGHLLPYLELAERVASRGHRVSFVSTPRNIARLPPVSPAAAPRVDLVALPLPRVDGLPDGTECTNDVSPDNFQLLWKAFDGLAEPFAGFLAAADEAGKRPDWIIADTFNHWAPLVALQHKLPCAMLLPSASSMVDWTFRSSDLPSASMSELGAPEERRDGVPRYEWEQKARLYSRHGASGMSVAERCTLTMERCTLAAIRSCPEWEPEALRRVAAGLSKPLVPLGLVPPSADGGRRLAAAGEEEHPTLRWLDAQLRDSVVYVALGSEVPLRVGLVHELALGLELAGTRFLWALRKPRGVDDAAVLPLGFEERARARGRGVVAMGWVPQVAILAHAAVGAFLTHCGRNSLVEGLLFGNPLVMLPIFGDQGPNARLMERRKVGVQVRRDDEDGSFDRHGVADAVRAVMVDEDSRRVFVANALEMQKIVTDKELHDRYIDEFLHKATSYVDR